MSESSEAQQAPTNSNSFYAVALVFLVLLAVISGFYLGKQNKNPAASSIPSPTVSNPAIEPPPPASISATPGASASASPVASNLPASPEATTSGGLY
jgi:hypothetical protein